MLTMTGYDSALGVFRATDADGTQYYIGKDEVAENRQWAEVSGDYATPEAAWADADRQWDTDMAGVMLAATWPNAGTVLTRSEAANLLGVSKTQVARLVATGALPTVPLPGAGVRRTDVERYAADRRPRGRPKAVV